MARPIKQVAKDDPMIEYCVSFTINKIKYKSKYYTIDGVNSTVSWAKAKGSKDIKVVQKKMKYDKSP